MRLERLEIENFGLIANASLAFADGFTVCTGETGSGKTMLLGALGFALGERSSGDVVRRGAERARVALALDPDAAMRASLAASGFPSDDGEDALLVREMTAAGKSTARINGRLATASQLRDVGAALLETVGQHEQQRLLSHAYQLDALDAFAGDAALRLRASVGVAYARVRALEGELAEADASTGRALADVDFARFAAREIDDAAIADGEDDALRERRDYLANVERIAAALGAAHGALATADGSALESLGAAAAALGGIARFGEGLGALAGTLAALQSEAGEAAARIAGELEATEFDAGEAEAVGARLDAIERLKKKHGGSLAAIRAARERVAAVVEREDSRDAAARDARDLAALRARAVRTLEKRVAAELVGLAMRAARFSAGLETLPALGPAGTERVEFALAANAGEPLRPLARAASGGELSRVLLALVVVLAGRRERTALVFDEIDAGIGGATASAVGVRLAALARGTQVLCVTHLAQIASWADRHYALRKRESKGATTIELVALDERPVVLEEIARMLSGSSAAVALEHAESLVRDAAARKHDAKLTA